jgi:serine acetyltransferase
MSLFCDFKVNNTIGKLVMFTHRFGNLVHYNISFLLFRASLLFIYRIMDFINVKVIAGADIPRQCKIGPGLTLGHGGRGIVISPLVVIGSNVRIFHQVTIGQNYPHDSRWCNCNWAFCSNPYSLINLVEPQ